MIFHGRGGLLDRIGIRDIDGQNQSPSPGLFDLAPCAVEAIKAACEKAATLAPRFPNSRAIALPRPADAPVTTTVSFFTALFHPSCKSEFRAIASLQDRHL